MSFKRAALTALPLTFLIAGALSAQGPRGHWSGAIELPNHQLAIEVDLDLAANMWIGSMSIPEQNVSGAPLENIAVINGKWTFRMKGAPGNPTYTGAISPDGKTMVGELTQGPSKLPFRLLRAGDAQVEIPKSSPAVAESFIGTWEGALNFATRPLRLVLKLANDEAGAKAILISVDQGGGEIPVAAVEQTGTKLDLQISAIGSAYKGEINREGTLLTGTWMQAGQPMPLNFRKAVQPGQIPKLP
ncbi:MAG: hypothetical protein M3N54_06190 [Acidobacteriota bacterium]|nr:hypothetical protein [Acidobacteriota bacterium]